jgi:hypothetical protein
MFEFAKRYEDPGLPPLSHPERLVQAMDAPVRRRCKPDRWKYIKTASGAAIIVGLTYTVFDIAIADHELSLWTNPCCSEHLWSEPTLQPMLKSTLYNI